MTEYRKLLIGEYLGHTVEIRECGSHRCGVANHTAGGRVAVFYGKADGSDDCVISRREFNRRFKITSIICE